MCNPSSFDYNCRLEEVAVSRLVGQDARPLLHDLALAYGDTTLCPTALLLAAGVALTAEATGLSYEEAELLVHGFAEGVARGWLEVPS